MGADERRAGRTPEQTASAVVDLLEREPLVADRVSRDLLAQFTGELLGNPLQAPESAFRRQWLLAFVAECCRYDGGLHAMVQAIGRLDGRGRVHDAVAAVVGETDETTRADADPLSPAEVAALAEAYSDRAAARHLLARAGLSYGRHPNGDGSSDSYAFWSAVNRLLVAGAIADGRRRILAEASSDYPVQRRFSCPH